MYINTVMLYCTYSVIKVICSLWVTSLTWAELDTELAEVVSGPHQRLYSPLKPTSQHFWLSEALMRSFYSLHWSDLNGFDSPLWLSDQEKSSWRNPVCCEEQRAEDLLPPADHQRNCINEAASAACQHWHKHTNVFISSICYDVYYDKSVKLLNK